MRVRRLSEALLPVIVLCTVLAALPMIAHAQVHTAGIRAARVSAVKTVHAARGATTDDLLDMQVAVPNVANIAEYGTASEGVTRVEEAVAAAKAYLTSTR